MFENTEDLKFGPADESYAAAVERYKAAFSILLKEEDDEYDEDDEDEYEDDEDEDDDEDGSEKDLLNFRYYGNKPTAQQIAESDQKVGCPMPESLRKFYMEVGASGNDYWDENSYRYGLCFNYPRYFRGLMDYIRDDWYHMADVALERKADWFERYYKGSQESINFLNENYIVFANYGFGEDHAYLLVYGKNGKMGVIHFAQDYWDWKDMEYLTNTEYLLRYDSIEEMISRMFNAIIHFDVFRIQEWNTWVKGPYELIDRNKG